MCSSRQYPIFLNLTGKTCLVVGAGAVAERKISALIGTGAIVKVIGQNATAQIRGWEAEKLIELVERDFTPADTNGAFLVIAATDNNIVNGAVHDEASAAGALVNVVDQPGMCDFTAPAVVRRGRLQIAVSTGGDSPALAAGIRERLENEFDASYADYVRIIGQFRIRVRGAQPDPVKRREAYSRLLASDLLERIKQGQTIDIENLVERYAG